MPKTIQERMRATYDGYASLTDIAHCLGRKVYDWPYMHTPEAQAAIRKGILIREVYKGTPWELGLWVLPNVAKDYIEWVKANKQYDQTYYTALEYMGLHDLDISDLRLGMKATKLSKAQGIPVEKVPDDIYGFLNAYHHMVLAEAVKLISE